MVKLSCQPYERPSCVRIRHERESCDQTRLSDLGKASPLAHHEREIGSHIRQQEGRRLPIFYPLGLSVIQSYSPPGRRSLSITLVLSISSGHLQDEFKLSPCFPLRCDLFGFTTEKLAFTFWGVRDSQKCELFGCTKIPFGCPLFRESLAP